MSFTFFMLLFTQLINVDRYSNAVNMQNNWKWLYNFPSSGHAENN